MKNTIFCLSLLLAGLAQAQPVVAPSPDRTGSPRGTTIGSYNVTDSVEVGYRFTNIDGDAAFFHNTENFGNGLRVFGANLTVNSLNGRGSFLDSLTLNTSGLGNDPYSMANLRIEKNDFYRYDMTWRRSLYNNLPLDNGTGANLMNTRRTMQDHDLTISAAKWAKLKLGYVRVTQGGEQDSNYEAYIGGLARSVLPLLQNVRRDYNEYRLGTELDFLGFRLTLSRQWEYNKDDTTTDPLVPGQPYARSLVYPYQPDLPVTYPSLVTAYMRSNPMHGVNNGWFANLSRASKFWAVNGRVTYTMNRQSTFYYENETGASASANTNCSNCGAGAPTTAFTYMPGSSRRPFTAGDFTFSLFPTSRLTIVNSVSAQNSHEDGVGQMLQANFVAATKNILWDYRIGDSRFSDALEVNYRVSKWLGLHSEYRYTARWLENDLIRTGTTNNKDLNILNNHLNSGTFGIRVKPIKPLSFDVDATLGKDNSPLTPVAPAQFHNIRSRVDYRPTKRLRFGGSYRQVYNLNAPQQTIFTSTYGPPPISYFASHSRDFGTNASISLSTKWSIDASYNKRHLDTLANLWAELPTANPATIVSVPGYISQYISNIHTVSAMVRMAFHRRGTLYLGYNINKDTGDGRSQANLRLTNLPAAYLAGFNTFPMTYQSPLVRLSIRISPKLQWNAGWEFYEYNQEFAYFGYQPSYRTHSGYTSLGFTF